MRHTKFILPTLLALSFSANAANAVILNCSFDTYRSMGGGQKDVKRITVSWLGDSFAIDTAKRILQRGFDGKWAKPDQIQSVVRAANFTTYKWSKTGTSNRQETYNLTFSYRISNDKTVKAFMSERTGQYPTLTALGRCK